MRFMPSAAFVFAASLVTACGGSVNGVWFGETRVTDLGTCSC